MMIRSANQADMPSILAIYNEVHRGIDRDIFR